ncbi:ComEC/Rec2 family competence protein [Neotamlana laminarinivorans]|uniref:ComEC family competence protein n=1 Tax=Neotamlana laminarinivorans TaxID=2883124 RepID=A0A9X1L241_9FLAO|nr:ComEC/Rec2 family competence protein [Tamlana laminarinivorans]MCB4797264.1 ComEC family competence protein [Tamlana laminarinivorans]
MKLLSFTIIKLTICLITGILLGYFTSINLTLLLVIAFVFIFILFIIYIINKNKFKQSVWFGLFTFISMIIIGALTVKLHNPINFKNHYTQKVSLNNTSTHTIKFKVREVLKPGNYYDKYIVDILSLEDETTKGKILINIEKDTTYNLLKVDDIYISKLQFKDLIHPLNPHQFDYKKYLEKQYIYHQVFTTNNALYYSGSKKISLLGLADNIRIFINKKLEAYNFKTDELAIINALFLGQRQDISKAVYTNYTNAGAIHILAVSGLHVGIILIILNFILKPITQLKYGSILKTILLVFILWCFAVIAGLSASVTRAVTMFSIVAIAMNIKRPTNIFNTLAISVFVLLLIKPMFLFDVGFQLSYLAVFSIVTIDPFLYKIWQPKNWILDKYWHTFTITISAQLGIIPISLCYFHQFPGLFFISNLVVIPLLGIVLALGILVILLAICNIPYNFVASTFGYIIRLMNNFISWVSYQEAFIFKDIPFNIWYVFASYIFIITLVWFLIKKHVASFKFFLISIIVVQLAIFYTKFKKPTNTFIVFHKSRYSLLADVKNDNIIVFDDLDSLLKNNNKIIKDYTVGNHIKSVEKENLKTLFKLKDKYVLVIDSLGIYNYKSVKPDYVLLRQSPKINLNRLIDSLKPKQIIADGSNYKSYIAHWERICLKKEIPFHQTSKKGAFIINY